MSRPASPTIVILLGKAVRDENGCVVYTGYRDKQGYARVWHSGAKEKQLVHRVAYELFVGQIPEGLQIDHLCGVRHCINAEHLEAVTPLENTRRSSTGQYVKTHCVNGHEFSLENTRIVTRRDGLKCRACRRCDAARQAAYRARNPEHHAEVQRASRLRNRDSYNALRRARHASRRNAA